MPNRYSAVHGRGITKGPGDARPTALQIVKDEGVEGKLTGKNAVVTGVSSGIGPATAAAIAATGAHVFCTVRNVEKGKSALGDALSTGNVELIHMENDSMSSVRKAAAEILEKSGGEISILIGNAGVMAIQQCEKTDDGFEKQFATNHLSHFLLFQLLKEAMIKASTSEVPSRVVLVSSMGHQITQPFLGDYNFEKNKYDPWLSYGQSKTANIWTANAIERKYGSRGVHGYSIHPGGIWSGLQVHVPNMQADATANDKDGEMVAYMKSPEQGAATSVYAALSKDLEGKGGSYLEDCDIAAPIDMNKPATMGVRDGYALHAYSPDNEDVLWQDSLKLVGVNE